MDGSSFCGIEDGQDERVFEDSVLLVCDIVSLAEWFPAFEGL
jgi:hypothetical protein